MKKSKKVLCLHYKDQSLKDKWGKKLLFNDTKGTNTLCEENDELMTIKAEAGSEVI
jgi:hypothetical protein